MLQWCVCAFLLRHPAQVSEHLQRTRPCVNRADSLHQQFSITHITQLGDEVQEWLHCLPGKNTFTNLFFCY